MNDPLPHCRVRSQSSISRIYTVALAVLSVCTVISVLAVSIYASDLEPKLRGFLVVLVAYLIACVGLYRMFATRGSRTNESFDSSRIDAQLQILDEAREFFAGSLGTADTFRLVMSRVTEIVECDGCTLLLLDEVRAEFVTVQTTGSSLDNGMAMDRHRGFIEQCVVERDIIIDKASKTAALPLRRETEIFGVLILRFSGTNDAGSVDTSVLDAIGERAAPLFLASVAFERSQQNALTDASTELPNERAFHLVLENQVAESVRKAGTRPLTILSFDVKGLGDLTSRYGHAAAERVMNFAASTVKDDLRQMDFLARGRNEEFLAILPTASKEISHEIIARIQTALFGRKIKISEVSAVEIELDFGWASFGVDGETPADLLAVARERKEQSRSSLPGSVLWFPQEIAH